MSARGQIEEVRARLQLAQGSPTLLLAVAKNDAMLDETRQLLLEVLRATPLDVADLGACKPDTGPARWAEWTRDRTAAAYSLMFVPSTPLAAAAFARLLNAERELLRRLAGPLLLVVSRETERVLRQSAQDFVTWAAQIYEMPDLGELRGLAPQPDAASATGPAMPPEEPVRFLHISDLHLRPKRVKRYDQDRVLRGLIDFLRRDRAIFPLDLIFVTGDLAFSGKPEEYELVAQLLSTLMEVTGVPAERMFVVPGNHDVDRDVGQWLLRTLSDDEASIAFFTEPGNRRMHAQKFVAYRESMRSLLGASRPVGVEVGRDAVEIVEVRGSRLAITSLNSAWFSQGDDDEHKLWLGEPNVHGTLSRIAEEDAPFAVALLHHPFEDLHESERDDVKSWFERGFDLVLRGHLHRTKTTSIAGQRGGYVEVAAPAAYQGSQWANGCFLGEIRTCARTVRLRPFMFSTGPDPWVLDARVFPDDEKDGYCRTFMVPEKARLKSIAVRQHRYTETSQILAEEDDDFTIALANVVGFEADADGLLGSPISIANSLDLEDALIKAGRLLVTSISKIMFNQEISESAAIHGLAAALNSVVDADAIENFRTAKGRTLDIVIGVPGESPVIAVVKVKRVGRSLGLQRHITKALLQLDSYASLIAAQYYVLVQVGVLPRKGAEPRIGHEKSPQGREVVILFL